MRNEDIGSFELCFGLKNVMSIYWLKSSLAQECDLKREMKWAMLLVWLMVKKGQCAVERNKLEMWKPLRFTRRLWFSPWTAGSTVRLMASTSPSGQPSRKQSVTSKSKWPGFTTRVALLHLRASTLSFIKLGGETFKFKTVTFSRYWDWM